MDIVPRPFSFCKGKRHCVKHPPLQQNPPELENLPHAGPRGRHPAARGRGGSESRPPCFFMPTVSHTFPAYNGNVIHCGAQTTMLATLFSVRHFSAVCARVHERLSPQCPGTPRVKRFQKSRLFSDRGAKPFLWSAFLSGNFFLCAVLCGCAGVEGAFPCGGVPSWPKEEKRLPRPLPARGARLQTEAEPGYFPFQNLRLSGGRSNHTAQPFWKNLPKIRAFFFIGTNVLLVVQMPLALLSTSLSSTLPCS